MRSFDIMHGKSGLERREFLKLSGAALAAGTLPMTASRLFADEAATRLAMPPLLDTRESGRLALTAMAGQTSILGGAPARTAGYNQGYLGPTIIMREGSLGVKVDNALPEAVTVHWHGLLVPGHHDGSGHTPILPGQAWSPDMTIAQKPNTAWYHSHIHGRTAPQVYSGLAGVIHVTDGRDDARGLPSRYGIDDLTLVIQDRRFDDSGRMVYDPSMVDILNGFKGERVLINGQARATAAVPKGIVRLRLLNGSNARIYSLRFDDGRPMHLIATDGGFLPAPIALTHLRLAPGERAEVLVDFAQGSATPVLTSIRGLSMMVLRFATDDTLKARVTRMPDVLDGERAVPPPAGIPIRRFALNMSGSSTTLSAGSPTEPADHHDHHAGHGAGNAVSDFMINGRSFDHSRIDLEVRRGAVERWIVSGGGGIEHPFHVHGVHFRVDREGGGPPKPENSGLKDTIILSGETELIVRFDHPAGPDTPYMYHCHILEHEDAGMMGQFTVV